MTNQEELRRALQALIDAEQRMTPVEGTAVRVEAHYNEIRRVTDMRDAKELIGHYKAAWQSEVWSGNTILGYADWLDQNAARYDQDGNVIGEHDPREPTPEPREFSVSLAVSVRAYGTTTVMAHSMAEALEIVRAQTEAYNDDAIQDQCVWDQVTDVDWGTQFDYTLLSISDDEGDEEDIDDIELCDPKKPYEVISADALRSLIEAEE